MSPFRSQINWFVLGLRVCDKALVYSHVLSILQSYFINSVSAPYSRHYHGDHNWRYGIVVPLCPFWLRSSISMDSNDGKYRLKPSDAAQPLHLQLIDSSFTYVSRLYVALCLWRARSFLLGLPLPLSPFTLLLLPSLFITSFFCRRGWNLKTPTPVRAAEQTSEFIPFIVANVKSWLSAKAFISYGINVPTTLKKSRKALGTLEKFSSIWMTVDFFHPAHSAPLACMNWLERRICGIGVTTVLLHSRRSSINRAVKQGLIRLGSESILELNGERFRQETWGERR